MIVVRYGEGILKMLLKKVFFQESLQGLENLEQCEKFCGNLKLPRRWNSSCGLLRVELFRLLTIWGLKDAFSLAGVGYARSTGRHETPSMTLNLKVWSMLFIKLNINREYLILWRK